MVSIDGTCSGYPNAYVKDNNISNIAIINISKMNGRPCKRVDLLYSNMKTTDAEHIVDIIATPI